MSESLEFDLIQSVIDSQENLIVIFKEEELILFNKAFRNFHDIGDMDQYHRNYRTFVDHFVPHPLYFHKEHIGSAANWFDALMARNEIDRVVSMMSVGFEPHAFSVAIEKVHDIYRVVTFTDITQSLIKRIMIENHANIDMNSGAYAKEYFTHIIPSYEDAARFNEKRIGVVQITVLGPDGQSGCHKSEFLSSFVSHFKNSVRQDDMLVRWNGHRFLLIFLVDNEANAERMLKKLHQASTREPVSALTLQFSMALQQNSEPLGRVLNRISA